MRIEFKIVEYEPEYTKEEGKYIERHDGVRTKTMFITTKDLFKYIESIGYELNIIEL